MSIYTLIDGTSREIVLKLEDLGFLAEMVYQ